MASENNYKYEVSSFIALHDVKYKKTDKNDNIANIDSEPDVFERRRNYFYQSMINFFEILDINDEK